MTFAETIQALFQSYGQLPGITIECQKELIAIGVENKAARAEVFLQGAQVSRYQRKGERPIIWLSQQCDYKEGTPLRGGIPICWPWFGDLDKNPEYLQKQFTPAFVTTAPAHGFVRNQVWDVKNISIPSDNLTIIELSYIISEGAEPLWPFATELVYTIEVGQHLSTSLSVNNISQQAFTFSGALHSYFVVDSINNTFVNGFDGLSYVDALNNWEASQQEGDIDFDQEVDRIYQSSPKIITLIDGQRKIKLTNGGSKSTVVWNPWKDKAKRLSQFADDDYKTMVCIETANALDDVITLEPNERAWLSVQIE
ncbi:MAG: D-hexose-6-phosphate mutarotase [Cellvibrionaceae bacterium]